ncbi:hypothetical protein BD414DRAFT_501294 [Trametes punicea]|nr:hypothetical protein BD414DRAFT_501294 [Trametes punicea]
MVGVHVSTAWRTACAIIVIILGAALLTLVVYIWRRQKALRRPTGDPDMRQRFMNSYAGDPEARLPLLDTGEAPSLPPKTRTDSFHKDSPGEADEWGVKMLPSPPRGPDKSMPDLSELRDEASESALPRSNPEAVVSMPEPSLIHRLFLHLPRIQFPRDNTRLGRLPSLRVQFLRESNQVVSAPVQGMPALDKRASLPLSTSSGPSTPSRPFATMASSPPRPISPASPTSAPQSPRATNESHTERSNSIASIGHHLFSRKASGEDIAYFAFSRNPSQYSRLMPGPMGAAPGSGSASSESHSAGSASGLRRSSTWTPNILASYSPWKGVVQESWTEASPLHSPLPEEPSQVESALRPESPTGQLRLAEAYRPMPTLSEMPESVAATTIPRALPEPPTSLSPELQQWTDST